MSESPPRDQEQLLLPARTCPASVVVASRVLAAMALLLLAEMAVYAYDLVTLKSTVQRAGASVGASASEIDKLIGDLASYDRLGLGTIFFFVGFLTLAAVYIRLGRRSGQIIAIVVTLPLLTCLPSNFISVDETHLQSAALAAQPGWADAVDMAAYAVSPLGLIVIALLLTRSARAWFAMLPQAPAGYMWVPAPFAAVDWSNWPAPPPRDRR